MASKARGELVWDRELEGTFERVGRKQRLSGDWGGHLPRPQATGTTLQCAHLGWPKFLKGGGS